MTTDRTVAEAEVDAVVHLGQLALAFGRVNRATYHEDGVTPESDTDHTVMLALIACAIAARTEPGLDVGLVAQMALIHDLVEVYAGDTATLRIDATGLADKRAREAAALERLRAEFAATLPWLPEMLALYEEQKIPEARFVRGLDKAMPKITHLGNGARYLREQDMGRAEATAVYARQAADIRAYAGEFTAALAVRDALVDRMLDRLPEVWGPDDRPPADAKVFILEERAPTWAGHGPGPWDRFEDVAYPSSDAAIAAQEDIVGDLEWTDELEARCPGAGGPTLWRVVELMVAAGGADGRM